MTLHTFLATPSPGFQGRRVVRAAFVLAMFGWGIGFYGPPIFLHAVVLRTGWPLPWVSGAVTLHFLIGAAVVAGLPRIYRRIGIVRATCGGALLLAAGTVGWSVAAQLWQLIVAACLTGTGWVFLGAAAINAIVSPWFVEDRPMALSKAYNGASIGGVVFSPLLVGLIGSYGFFSAALAVSAALFVVVLPIVLTVISPTPASSNQHPDRMRNCVPATGFVPAPATARQSASRSQSLWRDRGFLTLAGAMALGLVAQIGLLTQLYSLLVPAIGAMMAGWLMAAVTGCGVIGRMLAVQLLGKWTDRRVVATVSYGAQAAGTLLLLLSPIDQLSTVVAGTLLFGLGIGNATSLPPLIAQQEFAHEQVPCVVARCVALAQALYAFAPAGFAFFLIEHGRAITIIGSGTWRFFAAILVVQVLAISCMLGSRRHKQKRPP